MNAFQPLRVQEAGAVTEQHPAVSRELRHGEPATIGKALGTISDHFAALEDSPDEGVALEALEDGMGVGARVLVVEAGDVADRYLGVAGAINPRAAVFARS